MTMKVNRSKSTMVREVVNQIDRRIKAVFNTNFFSIYEGIVEKIDVENAQLSVRIPELDDTIFEECRVMMPCSTTTSCIQPNFLVGTGVIVGFRQFNLNYPIILGSLNLPTVIDNPLEVGTIKISNGDARIDVVDGGITIQVGSSIIAVTASGISLDGNAVTAGSDNLLDDDKGVL